MACDSSEAGFDALTPEEQARYEAIRTAPGLSALASRLGFDDEHEAYFAAKSRWYDLRGRVLDGWEPATGFPGDCVTVDGRVFHVHGITHADTPAERSWVRDHVRRFLDQGGTVYCEQGIRRMYFDDLSAVYEMDDYSWAAKQCHTQDIDTNVAFTEADGFGGLVEDVHDLAGSFRESVFSLIDAGREVYGDEFASALGDVASDFLMSHEEFATAEDFTSFRKSRTAAASPERLYDLQLYYKRAFLPQPVEREWLRRHDPELELFTHARNERMADFAVFDSATGPVHLIVGAAHQPGICYYLDEHREGNRTVDAFEPTDPSSADEEC